MHVLDKHSMSYARIWQVYSLVSINTLSRTLKEIVACLYKCRSISWHDRIYVIIFPGGEVLTCRMQYINTVWYYWCKICSDGQFILFVTFLYSYLYKRLTRRKFISNYDITNSDITKPVLIAAQIFWRKKKSTAISSSNRKDKSNTTKTNSSNNSNNNRI